MKSDESICPAAFWIRIELPFHEMRASAPWAEMVRSPIDVTPLPASAVLSSRRASDALTDLGMTPGTGPAPPESLAGELYAIYDKIR